MQIITEIRLGPDEYASDLSGNATDLARKILIGVGGDETVDTSTVHIQDHGVAGATTPAPTPPSTRQMVAESAIIPPPSSPPPPTGE